MPATKKSSRKSTRKSTAKKAPKNETPAERAAREAKEAEQARTEAREAEAKGEPTRAGSLKAAAGEQQAATGEKVIVDRRTGVIYQPVTRPGGTVPLIEETLGQASNVPPEREATEARVVGARVEGEKNVVVTILPGTKEGATATTATTGGTTATNGETSKEDTTKRHGELHVAQKDTLNPDNAPKSFTPRQEGALDVHAALAETVEADNMGVGRSGGASA